MFKIVNNTSFAESNLFVWVFVFDFDKFIKLFGKGTDDFKFICV